MPSARGDQAAMDDLNTVRMKIIYGRCYFKFDFLNYLRTNLQISLLGIIYYA